MAQAHATEAWDHTAAILSLTFNVHRGSKSKAARVEDFHPYRVRRRKAMTVADLHSLKSLFPANTRRAKARTPADQPQKAKA